MKYRAPIVAVLLILFLTGCGHTLTREEAEKKLKEHLVKIEPDIKATLSIGSLNFSSFGVAPEPDTTIEDSSFGGTPSLDLLVNNNILICNVIKDIPEHDETHEQVVSGVHEGYTVTHLKEYKLATYKVNPDMPAEARKSIIKIYDGSYYGQPMKLMQVKLGSLSKVKCTGLAQEPNSNTCNAEFEVEYEPTVFATMGFKFETEFARTRKMNVTFTRYDDGWRM